jgi:hypothetical protein
MNAALTYNPIYTDSNFEPITIEIKRAGQRVPMGGLEGTITVRDMDTRERIVDNAPCELVNPGIARFYFTSAQVSRIHRDGTWLVEWKIVEPTSGRTLRLPPGFLPVRVKL